MKAYDEEKFLLSVLTLDDLSVTQDQGQKCKILTVLALLITWNHLNIKVLCFK